MAVVPTDVVPEILSYLPVKTLQRFKTVTKAWYNLISEPWFVDLHRQRSRRNLNILYVGWKEERNFLGQFRTNLTFTCTDCESNISEVFTKTLENCSGLSHFFSCVSSYNDLICFMTERKSCCEHIYLYNPVSHQVFPLPERKKLPDYSRPTTGFGYVSSTREYKVMRLHLNKSDIICEILSFCLRSDGSIINDPCSSSWREIIITPQNNLCKVSSLQAPAFVRECFHWLASAPLLMGQIIISFDLRTEKFSTILLPSELIKVKNPYKNLIVDDFQGKLILVNHHSYAYMSLWVLEDYDKHIWNRLYDIDFRRKYDIKMSNSFIYDSDFFHIYGYMPNGELFVFAQDSQRKFYSHNFYDAKSDSMRRSVPAPIQNTAELIWRRSFYWESMVTL